MFPTVLDCFLTWKRRVLFSICNIIFISLIMSIILFKNLLAFPFPWLSQAQWLSSIQPLPCAMLASWPKVPCLSGHSLLVSLSHPLRSQRYIRTCTLWDWRTYSIQLNSEQFLLYKKFLLIICDLAFFCLIFYSRHQTYFWLFRMMFRNSILCSLHYIIV